MPRLTEARIARDFPTKWQVTKDDDWAFYRHQFQNCCSGHKAMDFLGFDPDEATLWMGCLPWTAESI